MATPNSNAILLGPVGGCRSRGGAHTYTYTYTYTMLHIAIEQDHL